MRSPYASTLFLLNSGIRSALGRNISNGGAPPSTVTRTAVADASVPISNRTGSKIAPAGSSCLASSSFHSVAFVSAIVHRGTVGGRRRVGRSFSSPLRTRGGSSSSPVVTAAVSTFLRHHRRAPQNGRHDQAAVAVASTAALAATAMTACGDDGEHPAPMPFPEESLTFDTYNGVTVDVAALPAELTSDPDIFEAALQDAVQGWKQEGKMGIWLKVPTTLSQLIPPSVNVGFDFQVAKKGHVVLTRWLPDDSESRLPNPPSTQVGVGALVLHPDARNKMLVVQERSGPAAKSRLWKMPTGLTDPGEDVPEAAVREVREETGLVCTFDRIVCLRHAHDVGSYGASDLFFVCLLRVDEEYYRRHRSGSTAHDMELRPQESEIAGVDWMEVDSFANQDLWTGSPLYTALHAAMFATIQEESSRGSQRVDGTNKKSGGFIAKTLPIGFRPASNTIYLSRV